MKYQGHCYPFTCRTTHANMHSLSVQLSTCPTAQLWQTTTSAVWNLCFKSHMWKLNRSKAYGQGYYSFRSLNIMWVCPLQSPEFSTFTLDRPSIEQLYTFLFEDVMSTQPTCSLCSWWPYSTWLSEAAASSNHCLASAENCFPLMPREAMKVALEGIFYGPHFQNQLAQWSSWAVTLYLLRAWQVPRSSHWDAA